MIDSIHDTPLDCAPNKFAVLQVFDKSLPIGQALVLELHPRQNQNLPKMLLQFLN